MAVEIKELLAVLDLPEEEQYAKLAYYIQPKPWNHLCAPKFADPQIWKCKKCAMETRKYSEIKAVCSIPDKLYGTLADLAFRLRGELKSDGSWFEALAIVSEKCEKQNDLLKKHIYWWWIYKAQPIHWIIAALIAKELTKGE